MEHSITEQLRILKHPNRPNSKIYIEYIFTDFIELSGDRVYGNDPSIIGGVAFLDDIAITVIGQLRGNNLEKQLKYNFSMTYPEGYRKAIRLMKQAEKFGRPIICFVDTIGAYPGKQAEERGQSSAIANSLQEMIGLKVPIITVLIGNGCSGGALALCVADRIVALQNATLSVISPKACAEILWKNTSREIEAAILLKMSSHILKKQGIVDQIIPEPIGGAHENPQLTADRIKEYLIQEIKVLQKRKVTKLLKQRRKKFEKINKGQNV